MAGIVFFILCAATCPDPVPFCLAVFIHELAHILCAKALKMGKPKIRPTAAGLKIEYPVARSAVSRVLLCLSGPFAGILFAAVFHKWLLFSRTSLLLGILNLLPISCLDGGCILREVCGAVFLPDTAWKICRTVSVVFVLILWALTVFIQFYSGSNLVLMAVSLVLVVTILCDKT